MKKTSKELRMDAMKDVLAGVVVVALVLAATPVAADEGVVGYRGIGMATADSAYTVVEGSPLGVGAGMTLGYAPQMLEGFRFMAGFDQLGGSPEATLSRFDGDVDSMWTRTQLMAMADYTMPLVGDWLGPLGRVGVGYARQRLSLWADGVEYRGVDHGFGALVAGGLEVRYDGDRTPEMFGDRLSFVANGLIGYNWHTAADFGELRTQESMGDDDNWERGTVDAGSMRPAGLTWEVGVMAQYRFGADN